MESNKAKSWKKWRVIVPMFLAILCIVAGSLFSHSSDNTNMPVGSTEEISDIGESSSDQQTAETAATTSPPTSFTPNTPAYESPSLDELYTLKPYCLLLPQKITVDYNIESTYHTLYDPFSNPDNTDYLSLRFVGDEELSYLEISIYEDYSSHTNIADPSNPETYDLAYYYAQRMANPDLPLMSIPSLMNFSDLFFAEDITREIIEKRIYEFKEGEVDDLPFKYTAYIEIICGDYRIKYDYRGDGITVDSLYDMITSSEYFSSEK